MKFVSPRIGAIARGHVMAVALICVALFVIAPRAHADHRHDTWPVIPGDSHRDTGDRNAPPDTFGASFDHDDAANPFRLLSRTAVAALVRAKAEAIGVPVSLALAVAHFESGFRMSMHGAAGERGAMQVLPQTARQVGVTGDLYGPPGIEAGVRYLKLALTLHGRAGWCAVASAYNVGIWHGSRCTAYGRTVTAMASRR